MFRLAGLVAMGTVLVMAVVGEFILHYVFHIDFGAFMIAGGVLLVIIGVRTIVMGHLGERRASSESSAASDKRREQLIARAVSPLACPMIVGPGSIVASLLIVKNDELGMAMGLAAVVVAFLLTLAVLNWGHLILRALGRMGPIIIARIMMIFVTAIGVQYIYNGILELFPQLQ